MIVSLLHFFAFHPQCKRLCIFRKMFVAVTLRFKLWRYILLPSLCHTFFLCGLRMYVCVFLPFPLCHIVYDCSSLVDVGSSVMMFV